MILPIRTDSPLRSTPYMNWLIIAANVVMFAVQSMDPRLVGHYHLSPKSPTIFTFVSYAFLHGGTAHLVGNMLFLYIFGNNVCDKMGSIGYLGFYLAGAVFAGLCYTLTQHYPAPVIGASGAVAAVTGAYLILFPRSHVTIFYFLFFIGTIEIPGMWLVLGYFVMDLFMAGTGDGVAHAAHIGGTVFGMVLSFALLIPHLLPRDQFDVLALVQRWNKRRQYRDMVAGGYNPFAHATEPEKPRRLDPRAERITELRDKINSAFNDRDVDKATGLYVKLKELDSQQVLSRQNQLDVANQLMQDGRHAAAADAYELLLKMYPNSEQSDHVELILGILYSRYLSNYEKARVHLNKAVGRLHNPRELDMAREELTKIEGMIPGK